MRLTTAQNDRAAGVLLATAAGDALGAGYEFTYPTPETAIRMIGGGLGPFAPGEWTDDTSMALAIAEFPPPEPTSVPATDSTPSPPGSHAGMRPGPRTSETRPARC